MSIYLLSLSLLAVRPLNHSATRLRSLSTLGALPFLVPCLCCRRCACRTVCTPPESAARLLVRSHTCPNARGCRKRFAPLHRRMRSGANRLLGWGNDAPAPMRFSKDCRDLSKRTFPRARERVRTPHFSFFAFTLHLLVQGAVNQIDAVKEKVKVCVHLCLHRCAGVAWIVVGFGTKVGTFLIKVHSFSEFSCGISRPRRVRKGKSQGVKAKTVFAFTCNHLSIRK